MCQDSQSPKLIQFRTPSHNAPILPWVCVKFGRFLKPPFSICFVTELHTQYRNRTYISYSMCYQLSWSQTPSGCFSTHSWFSSKASNMRGVLDGTLSKFYFQQNASPYISHNTGTKMTLNDTGGIEIIPDHSVSCKHWFFHTHGPSPRSDRLNRRCPFQDGCLDLIYFSC
jgi:hypothetical protein